MKKKWQYFVNPFLSVGLKSYRKAVKISTYTNNVLSAQTDPFYVAQYALYNPLHRALIKAYNAWHSQGGARKGSSVAFYQLLRQLRFAKVNAWNAAVRIVYPKGSAGYVAIFPKGHKPFQNGAFDSRISTVGALSKSLDGIASLAATKNDVDAFHNLLKAARAVQQGNKSDVCADNHLVEKAVIDAMKGLYCFLASGMLHFSTNPSVLAPMFDLQTIRQHREAEEQFVDDADVIKFAA